jgi:hypothetical protein
MKRTLLVLTLFSFFTAPCFATSSEDSRSKTGIMVSLQGTHSDIVLPFRISPNILLGPSISFFYAEDVGSDIGIGVLFKSYQTDQIDRSVARFWSLRSGLFFASPKNGDSSTDMMFGIGYGADYYLHPNVALGAEAQLNLVKSDKNSSRFGNPGGVNVNTAGSLALTIFF